MDLAPVSAELPPFKNLQKFSDNGRIWRFLEIGVPLVIIHFHGIFHERNHPAFLGYPHDLGNPQMDG
jgi:hypothetical protein